MPGRFAHLVVALSLLLPASGRAEEKDAKEATKVEQPPTASHLAEVVDDLEGTLFSFEVMGLSADGARVAIRRIRYFEANKHRGLCVYPKMPVRKMWGSQHKVMGRVGPYPDSVELLICSTAEPEMHITESCELAGIVYSLPADAEEGNLDFGDPSTLSNVARDKCTKMKAAKGWLVEAKASIEKDGIDLGARPTGLEFKPGKIIVPRETAQAHGISEPILITTRTGSDFDLEVFASSGKLGPVKVHHDVNADPRGRNVIFPALSADGAYLLYFNTQPRASGPDLPRLLSLAKIAAALKKK